jgi:2-polyprenyl-3-methyl-5-hydroxy-6-metoxy-1,4-benzoquinol methylase
MDYSNQKQHYEDLWKKVGNWKNESPNFKTREPQKETLDFINFLLKRKVQGRSLDVGCGGGRHVIAFAKAGFDSYGLDYSKTAIKLARLDSKDKKIKINLKTGDVLALPYKKDFFDVIHDSGCLHHLTKKDWSLYFNNVLDVLKKKGYYKLFCFSKNTKFLTGKKIEKNYITHKSHYTHFFTKEEIKNTFEKYFKIITIVEEKRKQGLRSFYIVYMQKK